jgi:hypothetical protein
MKMGETPIQAANSAIRLAHIIYKAGVNGFNPTHELRELLTTADLKGGAFFTNTLHEYIRTTVEWKMDKKGIRSGGDPEGEWNTWIEVAEEKFKLIRGRGDEVDRRIHEELKNRKALNPNGGGVYQPNIEGMPAPAPAPRPNPPPNPPRPRDDKDHKDNKDDKYYCKLHGRNSTHTTGDCKVLKKGLESANPEVIRALTTTLAPGTDLTSKGQRPNANYNGNRDGGDAHDRGNGDRRDLAKCQRCSNAAGRSIWHNQSKCYLEPGVEVPDWFNPMEEGRRKIVNDKRRAQGLGELPPFRRQPPRHGVARTQGGCSTLP